MVMQGCKCISVSLLIAILTAFSVSAAQKKQQKSGIVGETEVMAAMIKAADFRINTV